ncbi:hypothetical protein [Streptomyces sp. NPDC005773]
MPNHLADGTGREVARDQHQRTAGRTAGRAAGHREAVPGRTGGA